MTAQNLKNAILQLAMQGKLVPQDPEDEPASELLKHIQVEKSKLAKEGKRKKRIPLQPISVDEIPFDIPESWVWVRLGECSSYAQKKEKADKNTIAPDTWSLDLEDIEKGTGRIIQKCLLGDRNASGERVIFQKGQILYSKLRPYLKKVLVAPNDGVCSSEIVPFSVYAGINAQYIVYVLITPHIDFAINSVTYGTKMPRVGTDTMTNLLIPLPPLAEQARIVAKIEELLPYIEEYDAAEKRLATLNKKFPDQLRKSILQQAIMGKLTERDPADEPASELLKRIRTEKSRLVKEGKLKKEKPLPPITEDEMPFEIPEGWEWVRLQDAATAIVDCPHSTPKYLDNETGFYAIGTKGMNGDGEITHLFNVDEPTYLRRTERLVPQAGDIVYSREGSIICRAVILPEEKRICLGQRVMLIRCNIGFVLKFLQVYLMSELAISYLTRNYKGTGVRHVNVADVCSLPIPLPPLAEQQRIVERLEELLAVCGQLK